MSNPSYHFALLVSVCNSCGHHDVYSTLFLISSFYIQHVVSIKAVNGTHNLCVHVGILFIFSSNVCIFFMYFVLACVHICWDFNYQRNLTRIPLLFILFSHANDISYTLWQRGRERERERVIQKQNTGTRLKTYTHAYSYIHTRNRIVVVYFVYSKPYIESLICGARRLFIFCFCLYSQEKKKLKQ